MLQEVGLARPLGAVKKPEQHTMEPQEAAEAPPQNTVKGRHTVQGPRGPGQMLQQHKTYRGPTKRERSWGLHQAARQMTVQGYGSLRPTQEGEPCGTAKASDESSTGSGLDNPASGQTRMRWEGAGTQRSISQDNNQGCSGELLAQQATLEQGE